MIWAITVQAIHNLPFIADNSEPVKKKTKLIFKIATPKPRKSGMFHYCLSPVKDF